MALRIAFTAAVALAMTVGCSATPDAQTEEATSTTESALTDCDTPNADGFVTDCDGPSPAAFQLTSFSSESGTIRGVNGFGDVVVAQFDGATKFHKANLNKYIPQEPVFPYVVQYNSLVAQGNGRAGVAAIVNGGGFARMQIKGNNVKGFRPVSAH